MQILQFCKKHKTSIIFKQIDKYNQLAIKQKLQIIGLILRNKIIKAMLFILFQIVEEQNDYIFQKMSSDFLSRFIGKAQTIPKQGIETMLKGTTDTLIYTNTIKSFNRTPSHHIKRKDKLHSDGQTQFESIAIQQKQCIQQELHLPHLNQRYLDAEIRSKGGFSRHQNPKMYLDKQTNWLIQTNDQIEQQIVAKKQQPKYNETSKQNINVKTQRIKDERRLLSYNFKSTDKLKMNKVGGLGPNIGGQEWQQRRQKKQKAEKYANELKRKNKQKFTRDLGETQSQLSVFRVGKRNLINSRN